MLNEDKEVGGEEGATEMGRRLQWSLVRVGR